jgi:hypothetical protein
MYPMFASENPRTFGKDDITARLNQHFQLIVFKIRCIDNDVALDIMNSIDFVNGYDRLRKDPSSDHSRSFFREKLGIQTLAYNFI